MEGSLSGGCHLLTSSCFVFSHSWVRISVSFILPRCKAELADYLDLVHRDDYLIYRREYVDTRYMHTIETVILRKEENTPKIGSSGLSICVWYPPCHTLVCLILLWATWLFLWVPPWIQIFLCIKILPFSSAVNWNKFITVILLNEKYCLPKFLQLVTG